MRKLLLVFSILLLATGMAFASADVGKIASFKGKTEVISPGSVLGQSAKKGMSLAVDDVIRTRRNATAEVALADGVHVDLEPDSRMKIHGFDGSSPSNASIQNGVVHFKVDKRQRAQGLQFASNVAIIGVKGTEFTVSVTPTSTAIEVHEGKVSVAHAKIPNISVDVIAGQMVRVYTGSGKLIVNEVPGQLKKAEKADKEKKDKKVKVDKVDKVKKPLPTKAVAKGQEKKGEPAADFVEDDFESLDIRELSSVDIESVSSSMLKKMSKNHKNVQGIMKKQLRNTKSIEHTPKGKDGNPGKGNDKNDKS